MILLQPDYLGAILSIVVMKEFLNYYVFIDHFQLCIVFFIRPIYYTFTLKDKIKII